MEFGRVEKGAEMIDHTLPPDGRTVDLVLPGKPVTDCNFYVGCAKWGRKEWVGLFYPEKTKERDFLFEYAKRLDTIELGATFYGLPDQSFIERFANQVALAENENFLFLPKMFREITHIRRLRDCRELLDQYLDNLVPLGKHLGPHLVQLGDAFGPKQFDDLKKFVEVLPSGHQYFFELRHPNWFSDEIDRGRVFNLFREHGVGTVMADTSGRRDCLHMEMGTPDLYVRFNGNGKDYRANDLVRINAWAERIAAWKAKGLRNVYFIIHQSDEVDTPMLASLAINTFNEKLAANVRPIDWSIR